MPAARSGDREDGHVVVGVAPHPLGGEHLHPFDDGLGRHPGALGGRAAQALLAELVAPERAALGLGGVGVAVVGGLAWLGADAWLGAELSSPSRLQASERAVGEAIGVVGVVVVGVVVVGVVVVGFVVVGVVVGVAVVEVKQSLVLANITESKNTITPEPRAVNLTEMNFPINGLSASTTTVTAR